tara:strand:- start:18171 stop:19703 length:1533 start_codon:yes stop_codon:yes gene_type:complete
MKAPEQTLKPRWVPLWWILVAVAMLALFFGIWCFGQQLKYGDIVTGHRNPGYGGAAWGLYIVFYVFFVGVSFAGISVSALSRLFHIEILKPATRIAELMTISALIAGSCAVFADLGRPLNGLLDLPRLARPQSPFYGTFTLVVAGYLFSSMVFFFLSARHDAAYMAEHGARPLRWVYRLWATGYRGSVAEQRRHNKSSFWLSVTILPLLVAAHSTLGFIFGIQAGRPGWFSALQAPAFVVLAGVSGTGMVILALAAARKIFALEEEIPLLTMRWLTNLMATLAMVYLYLMFVEELTSTYAAPSADRQVAHVIVSGRYAPMFWITVGCLVLTFAIPFVMRLRKVTSLPLMIAVSLLANVAALLKRFLIVVPSQTDGSFIPMEHSGYSPSIIEYGIGAGLFGILVLAVLLFGRIFPLVPSGTLLPASKTSGADSRTRAWLRFGVAGGVACAALLMITVGLADSFRLFSAGELDPRIPYSPLIFAGGLMLLFCSAIAYEALPGTKSSSDSGIG